MNNIRKTVSRFLVLGLLAGGGFFAIRANDATFSLTHAATEAPQQVQKALKQDAPEFPGEVEANTEELGVSIAQCTKTDTSQLLTVSFRSKTVAGFKTARGNYIVQVDDMNFTGDASNPAPDGYEILDEESGLPMFDGVVSFVLGGNSTDIKNVYLPSTLTMEDSFVIRVKKITKHCVTETGEEYHDKNKWYVGDPGSDLKITNIYIPDTIKECDADAFTGVPATGVTIHYEGSELPDGFDPNWTDADPANLDIRAGNYDKKTQKKANIGGKVDDIEDELGRPVNFILGCKENEKYKGPEYNKPLVIQYDLLTLAEDGKTVTNRETKYEELPLANTANNPYDSVGKLSSLSYSRQLGYKLERNQIIDDDSVVFHNIMKASDKAEIDTSQVYYARPSKGYSEMTNISKLVSVKASKTSKFAGYFKLSLSMDKNLSITSHKYLEPHSLYLDVKPEMYEQNLLQIKEGTTRIRYSLYNLYNSSLHIVYQSGQELKEVDYPISTPISYQTLDHDKNNEVSILVKTDAIKKMEVNKQRPYADFEIEKIRTFDLKNITIQMDLYATSKSGSTTVIGKSAISYKFAYINIFEDTKVSVFDWNLFLIFFFIGYVIVYGLGAMGLYFFMKEKFKNDEFRRVDNKKFLKKALVGGFGGGIIVASIVFIILRTVGFKNTIVVFNPTDPLLIGFSIAAMIALGYFIVLLVKAIKAEKDRRKAIRLKLNEDVDDDGTN